MAEAREHTTTSSSADAAAVGPTASTEAAANAGVINILTSF